MSNSQQTINNGNSENSTSTNKVDRTFTNIWTGTETFNTVSEEQSNSPEILPQTMEQDMIDEAKAAMIALNVSYFGNSLSLTLENMNEVLRGIRKQMGEKNLEPLLTMPISLILGNNNTEDSETAENNEEETAENSTDNNETAVESPSDNDNVGEAVIDEGNTNANDAVVQENQANKDENSGNTDTTVPESEVKKQTAQEEKAVEAQQTINNYLYSDSDLGKKGTIKGIEYTKTERTIEINGETKEVETYTLKSDNPGINGMVINKEKNSNENLSTASVSGIIESVADKNQRFEKLATDVYNGKQASEIGNPEPATINIVSDIGYNTKTGVANIDCDKYSNTITCYSTYTNCNQNINLTNANTKRATNNLIMNAENARYRQANNLP